MTTWPRTDMHLHATHYRLQTPRLDMTVENIVRHLEAESYSSAGIVEHLNENPKHPLSCLQALVAEFRSISSRVDLFVGAELDYRAHAITVPQAPAIKRRLGLDFYLAAAHGLGDGVSGTDGYIQDQHRRLMGIVTEYDYVDIVAHPWSEGHGLARRGLIDEWCFGLIPERYLREFVDAARAHGKAIEINRKALADADDPAFRRYLHLLRDQGVRVTVGSDAHSMDRLGATEALTALLQDAGFKPGSLWRPARQ